VGGKWSFDVEKRRRLPAELQVPSLLTIPPNKYTEQALKDINEQFSKNPRSTDAFVYPVTHQAARRWLRDLLKHRLDLFGTYEDAISTRSVFVFHSVLSPLLNSGLLTPKEVLEEALAYAERRQVPLNSIEGFVRQIVGWREFTRGVYLSVGGRQRKSNFCSCRNKLPKSFYSGTTGIEPVDTIIKRVLRYGYCHHIERLMVLGNFMQLCEIHPDQVYC